jgi:hypothetical protein
VETWGKWKRRWHKKGGETYGMNTMEVETAAAAMDTMDMTPASPADATMTESGKVQEKGLLARMPENLRNDCVARMRVLNYSAGQTIIEQNTFGTTMV